MYHNYQGQYYTYYYLWQRTPLLAPSRKLSLALSPNSNLASGLWKPAQEKTRLKTQELARGQIEVKSGIRPTLAMTSYELRTAIFLAICSPLYVSSRIFVSTHLTVPRTNHTFVHGLISECYASYSILHTYIMYVQLYQ